MQEILILGRGGQGAQTAGNLLARAFYAEGMQVQTFATYGGARRGTPVTASLRVDHRPIRLRCNIESATAVLCFDDSLFDDNLRRSATAETRILVNTSRGEASFSGLGDFQVITVDGNEIARSNGMGKVVNSALLGAFVAILGQPRIETMSRVVEEMSPLKQQQNVASCNEGFQRLQQSIQQSIQQGDSR